MERKFIQMGVNIKVNGKKKILSTAMEKWYLAQVDFMRVNG